MIDNEDEAAELSMQDKKGRTALHIAARNAHAATARVLLEHGASAMAKDKRGSTPLHYVAYHGPRFVDDTAHEIIVYGPDTVTMLYFETRDWFLEIAEKLLKYGANVDAKDKAGRPPCT